MRRLNNWGDDSGSASLEFVTAGVLLLVPIIYLVITMSVIQAAAFAAEGAARQAARVFVQSSTETDARAAAARAIEFALADYGLSPASVDVTITCVPRPDQCLSRQGFVTVSIGIAVPLPLAPALPGGEFPLTVPLGASATQQVSRFWDHAS